MNKMIKLPLFLGVVGGLCGGILALTNYFTEKKIAQDEFDRKNAALRIHFDNTNKLVQNEDNMNNLKEKGVLERVEAKNSNDELLGVIYTCEVIGFKDIISFSVSFNEGGAHKFIVTYSKEDNVGGTYLDSLKNVTGNELQENLVNDCGSTYTYQPVYDAVNECSKDYERYYK